MKTSQLMANNSQLQFRLKITALELITKTGIASTESTIATATATTAPTIMAENYTARTIGMFEIDHTNIEYRAEGNANIVLALPQTYQVLRLPKCSRRLRTNSFYSLINVHSKPSNDFFLHVLNTACILYTVEIRIINNLHLTLTN